MQEALFPREVTAHVPHITLTGREMLHVEQHRGLIACGTEQIVLRTGCGRLEIGGEGLHFGLYTAGEARILGQISTLRLVPEGGRP